MSKCVNVFCRRSPCSFPYLHIIVLYNIILTVVLFLLEMKRMRSRACSFYHRQAHRANSWHSVLCGTQGFHATTVVRSKPKHKHRPTRSRSRSQRIPNKLLGMHMLNTTVQCLYYRYYANLKMCCRQRQRTTHSDQSQ